MAEIIKSLAAGDLSTTCFRYVTPSGYDDNVRVFRRHRERSRDDYDNDRDNNNDDNDEN